MGNTPKKELQIKCPHCGNKFSPEAALEHDLRIHLEREFAQKFEETSKTLVQRIRKEEEEKFTLKLKSLDEDRLEKTAQLRELQERLISVDEREQQLTERESQVELELRRRLLESEKTLREKAEKNAREKAQLEVLEKQQELERKEEAMNIVLKKRLLDESEKVRSEERMKAADLQKQLDDQTRLVNELKRKSEQGSMQTQGEVQELAIEEYLKETFVRDEIEEIAKGKRGGDCIHHVIDFYGRRCGKILYESKRTKNFGGDWTAKLKEDMRLTQADIGVIVTAVLPNEMTRFGLHEGVWICTFNDFKALSALFRDSISKVGEVKSAQENRGEKMQLLYDYLTSVEFRQKLEAIVEAFQQMQDDLNKEKAQTMAHWARREKQIHKVMENTVCLYGDVRGIAGTAVKEIEALEIEEVNTLLELK